MFNAADCARKAGKFAFGLDEARTAQVLRKLAEDIERGKVALHSVSTSSHAAQDDFTVRELVIEVLEENPIRDQVRGSKPDTSPGPRVIKT